MNLTTNLKSWLRENCEVPETASDEEFKKAAAVAIVDDKLPAAKLAELTDEGPDPADMIGKIVAKAVSDEFERQKGSNALGTALESALANPRDADAPEKDKGSRAAQLFAKTEPSIRVKSPIERYDSRKTAVVYPKNDKHGRPEGHPVEYCGMPIDHPSQADKAVCGAFFKWVLNKGPARQCPDARFRMTDHDEDLVKYAMHEMPWTGVYTRDGNEIGIRGEKLSDFHRKILLDDTTSGGLEVVPIVFDEAIITTPVVYGELFPLVNVVPISRGRRIEGAAISNITFTSGPAEGTALTPFTTTSMVAAFDTTIYNCTAAIEIGNDFQADSPVAVANIIVEQAGKKHMEWLDNQIANGDGTTEPTGLYNTTSATDVGDPTAGANGAVTITDYENLYFGLNKAYRPPSDKDRTVFVANDTTYKRARAIAVGASDVRRVFGLTHRSYTLLDDIPFKVQNDMSNTYACCANLRYYRMYRRLGLNVRTETGGYTLATRNTTLVVLRSRWGGKMELSGAVVYSDSWTT